MPFVTRISFVSSDGRLVNSSDFWSVPAPSVADRDYFKAFKADRPGTAYVAPQILLDLDQQNPIMQEECFGPVAGVMPVDSDEEAIRLMNDNAFGLTAATGRIR